MLNKLKIPGSLFFCLFLFLIGKGQTRSVSGGQASVSLQKRMAGDPLDHLPAHIEKLTDFGERPDISPDNSRVAFMSKTGGDAMTIDMQSRKTACITCHLPGASFLRVLHLSNGDYLLIGPGQNQDKRNSKRDLDVWYMDKAPDAKPVSLGIQVSEGIAVSKKNLKIAYTVRPFDSSSTVRSSLVIADLVIGQGKAGLKNQKTVLTSNSATCSLEAQDFYDDDQRLTCFCYVPNGSFDAMGLDLRTGELINFSQSPGSFNEPEGIFPGGLYTAVESDRQCTWLGGSRGSSNLDIWKLKLDGTGKDFVRLTHFNDYEGGKAANPVVSGDGRFMAFQAARASVPPGTGSGILIYWFKK